MLSRIAQQAKTIWSTKWTQMQRSEIIACAITFILLGLIPLVLRIF